MSKNTTVVDLIRARSSCRTYRAEPLDAATRAGIQDDLARAAGPFGSDMRLALIASEAGDSDALKGLGTYGMIKNPAGFIIGALRESSTCFEDFGYAMETIILKATGRGLGTCWLGGTFSRGRFADRMRLASDEIVPAVVSIGHPADRRTFESVVRSFAGSDHRLHWGRLFFNGGFDRPLAEDGGGAYRVPLEMVRRGPSASNRQPWRVVVDANGSACHFFLQRSKRYRELNHTFFGTVDMQRIDMGIAMCHFELAALELGMAGSWRSADPGFGGIPADCSYTASWISR